MSERGVVQDAALREKLVKLTYYGVLRSGYSPAGSDYYLAME